jgi:hypothetical protein
MGLVFLGRDHTGKPSNLRDTGAMADLDRDGKVEIHEQEAILTAQYLLAAEIRLRELGHDVIPISDGSYAARHERVNAYAKGYAGRSVYVAAHLNASGGSYGTCLYDERSSSGLWIAKSCADVLRGSFTELSKVHVRAAGPAGDWVHAYNTIAGVYSGRAVGLCYEPCFLDGPNADELLSAFGLQRIGAALAMGLHTWLSS